VPCREVGHSTLFTLSQNVLEIPFVTLLNSQPQACFDDLQFERNYAVYGWGLYSGLLWMPYIREIPPSNLGLVIGFLSEIYEEFPQILKLIPGKLITHLSHDSTEKSCLATRIMHTTENTVNLPRDPAFPSGPDDSWLQVRVALARAGEYSTVINLAMSIRWYPNQDCHEHSIGTHRASKAIGNAPGSCFNVDADTKGYRTPLGLLYQGHYRKFINGPHYAGYDAPSRLCSEYPEWQYSVAFLSNCRAERTLQRENVCSQGLAVT